jgi:dTDP-4-dehydrorhamnose reductase
MKIVIIGAGGRLGAALVREYRNNFDLTTFNHAQLDLANVDEIRDALEGFDFDILINAAALTNVDLCEEEPGQAFRINAEAPGVLAQVCRKKNAKLIHFSTDYVFDGEKRQPYREEDPARPISVYGASKRAGEENVVAADSEHLVVRVSWVFGPDRPSFIDGMIARARENAQIDAVADKFSTPTYTRDIAEMLHHVVTGVPITDRGDRTDSGYSGILHFANGGSCTWQEYAQHALDCCREIGLPLKAQTVRPVKLSEMKTFLARRPAYTVLSTSRYTALIGVQPRPWRDAVAEYIREFVAS